MKAAIPILLACLGVLACSDEGTESVTTAPPDSVTTAPPDNSSSELSVSLAVTGDPAAGYADYPVYSDRQEIGRIKPGETLRVQLDGLSHVVELGPLGFLSFLSPYYGKPLSWCQPTTAESFVVHPTSSHPVSITFGLNCPPLDGEGEVKLMFIVPASWSGSTLDVSLHRISATPNAISFVAAPLTEHSIRLSPGVYEVDAHNGKCETRYIDWLFDELRVIVKKDVSSTYSFTLECD